MNPIAYLRLNWTRAAGSVPVLVLASAVPWLAPWSALAEGAGVTRVEQTRAATRYADRLQHIVGRASGSPGPNNALIILTSRAEAKEQDDLQEDLAIMSHIVDKAIDDNLGSEQRTRKALGVNLWFAPDAGSLRNSYLEGYGALFLTRVNFPLLQPPGKTESQKEEPPVTSTWEEARQEVLGTPEHPTLGTAPAEPYSEEKVNRLKTTLVDALKNAANVRHLKPDEGVTICVLGGSQPRVGDTRLVRKDATGVNSVIELSTGGAAQPATVLTLRARKSDIDAFAKGQMNADDFTQKVATATYMADTAAAAGGFGYGGSNLGGFGGYGGYGGGYSGSSR